MVWLIFHPFLCDGDQEEHKGKNSSFTSAIIAPANTRNVIYIFSIATFRKLYWISETFLGTKTITFLNVKLLAE